MDRPFNQVKTSYEDNISPENYSVPESKQKKVKGNFGSLRDTNLFKINEDAPGPSDYEAPTRNFQGNNCES